MAAGPNRPVLPRKSNSNSPTPGPWRLEYDGSVVIGGQIAIGPDSCGPDDVSREERKANCRLIAASPDMLLLLRALRCGVCSFCGKTGDIQFGTLACSTNGEPDDWSSIVNILGRVDLLAAIALAEGGAA